MGERMVLFGGTFDPIHHGHLIVARAVAERLHFERITLVPAAVSPHKTRGVSPAPAAGPEDRVEMVRRAVAGEDLFEVSEVELSRARPSYTRDTLLALREEHGPDVELVWIIGADMLADLPAWHRAAEVVDMARIVTAARPPYSERIERTLENLRVRLAAEQVARLAAGVVPTPLVDISSTQIRRRVREGRPISYLTPNTVIDYIQCQGLYVCGPGEEDLSP